MVAAIPLALRSRSLCILSPILTQRTANIVLLFREAPALPSDVSLVTLVRFNDSPFRGSFLPAAFSWRHWVLSLRINKQLIHMLRCGCGPGD
jgi:hypothetical protein